MTLAVYLRIDVANAENAVISGVAGIVPPAAAEPMRTKMSDASPMMAMQSQLLSCTSPGPALIVDQISCSLRDESTCSRFYGTVFVTQSLSNANGANVFVAVSFMSLPATSVPCAILNSTALSG